MESREQPLQPLLEQEEAQYFDMNDEFIPIYKQSDAKVRDYLEGLGPRKEGQLMESLRTRQLYYKDLKSGLQTTLAVVTMISTLVLSMDVGMLSA